MSIMKNILKFLSVGLFVLGVIHFPIYAELPGVNPVRTNIIISIPTTTPTPTPKFIQVGKGVIDIKLLPTIAPTSTITPSPVTTLSVSPTEEVKTATISVSPTDGTKELEKTEDKQTATVAGLTQKDKLYFGIIALLLVITIAPQIIAKIKKAKQA